MSIKIGQIWELNKHTDIDKMDGGSYMIILSRESGKDSNDGIEFNNVALFSFWMDTFGWAGAGVFRFTDEEVTRNAKLVKRLEDIVPKKDMDSTARSFERHSPESEE